MGGQKDPQELRSPLLGDASDSIATHVLPESGGGTAIGDFDVGGPYWNIFFLAMAWALTLTTSTLLTTIGPLSSRELGFSDDLASFTIGIFLLGAAASSVPSAWLFQRLGRLWGFAVGCLCQVIGSLLSFVAISQTVPLLLYFGCFFVGLGQGLGQFYRFSAVEVSPDHLKASAVTYVLSGGVIAAFMGPISANNTANLTRRSYEGSFLIMGLIGFLNFLDILMVRFPHKEDHKQQQLNVKKKFAINEESETKNDDDDDFSPTTDLIRSLLYEEKRLTLREITMQPLFIVSCAVATLAHTIMVMVMSAVTLAMTADGYSFAECSLVMELHFFAMFGPGFITGRLIGQIGVFNVALIGGVLFAASVVVLGVGTASWNYILGMILIGVGWNLSFSSGTVMLTGCYKPVDATRVQAVNDFILFSVASASSLIAGVIFGGAGWSVLIYVVTGLITANLLLFFTAHRLKSAVDQSVNISTNGSANSSTAVTASHLHDRIVSGDFGDKKSDIIRKLSRSGTFSVESVERDLKIIDRENSAFERVASLTPV